MPTSQATRILPRGGPNRVRKLGLPRQFWGDLYHHLLKVSWPTFLALVVALYLAVNALFALGYVVDPGGISGARPGSLADAFSFSVQTLATIGYGAMAPQTPWTHALVTLEAVVGVLMTAMATGLMFAKFSRPTARVMFTDVAVVAMYNGVPTLMWRMANARGNQIVEARLTAALVRLDRTTEGEVMRRIYDLPVVRRDTIAFTLTWTGMHAIDATSPLYGVTLEQMHAEHMEVLISLSGLDETMAQTVHAHWSYLPDELRWGHRFVDIVREDRHGRRYIDYRPFHHTEPQALPASAT